MSLTTPQFCSAMNDKGKPLFSQVFEMDCAYVITIDPRTDPDGVIPGADHTYLQHEQEHVKCSADALDWARMRLEDVVAGCCTEKCLGLRDRILKAAKRRTTYSWRACSYRLDATEDPTYSDQKRAQYRALSARNAELSIEQEDLVNQLIGEYEGTCGSR